MTTDTSPGIDPGLEGYGDHHTPEEIAAGLARQQERDDEYRTGSFLDGEQYVDELQRLRSELEAIIVEDRETSETLTDIAEGLEGVLSGTPRENKGDRETLKRKIHQLDTLARGMSERADDLEEVIAVKVAYLPPTVEEEEVRGDQSIDVTTQLQRMWEQSDIEAIRMLSAKLQAYWDEGRRDVGLAASIYDVQIAINVLEKLDLRLPRPPADSR